MKTTVEIDDTLFRKAKQHCARQGVPFRFLIESALRRAMAPDPPAQAFRLKPFGFKGTGRKGTGQQVQDWATIRERIYEGRGGAPGDADL